MLSERPLPGTCDILQLEHVPCTGQLQVVNIGSIPHDALTVYFENKRSGGLGEVHVEVCEDDQYAIVTCETHAG